MASENSKYLIFDMLINSGEITTKELNSNGFRSNDITNLVNEGFLNRIKRGYYEIVDVEELFYYGKKLIANKQYKMADKCFYLCYQLKPDFKSAAFQLFYRAIQARDYDNAFKYLDVFYDEPNRFYAADCRFYLFLLSNIVKLPEKYADVARNLEFDDVKISYDDKRYKLIDENNKIRKDAFTQKFYFALKEMNDLLRNASRKCIQEFLVKELLEQAKEAQATYKNELIVLAKNGEYRLIIGTLKDIENRHKLSLGDKIILYLATELKNINDTNKISDLHHVSTDKIYHAVLGRDFELALELSNKGHLQKNIDSDDDPINILLRQVVDFINKQNIIVDDNDYEQEDNIDNVQDLVSEKKVSTNIEVVDDANYTFSDVVTSLLAEDVDIALEKISCYLKNLQKSEYEFLIEDLIRICLMKDDTSFVKPISTLSYVSRDEYQFDLSFYLEEFYKELDNNNYDIARLYLHIISGFDFGDNNVLANKLEKILNKSEELFNQEEQDYQEDYQDEIEEDYEEKEDTIVKKEPQRTVTRKKQEEVVQDYTDFINKQMDALERKGIVMLHTMDSAKRHAIYKAVGKNENVEAFSIGSGDMKRVVLRYKVSSPDKIDYSSIISEGNKAYINNDIKKSLECYRQLLQVGEPKIFVYAKLGLIYLKKKDVKTAIDYLTIATERSIAENDRFDFSSLIASLKGEASPQDKKAIFKMNESEFDDDLWNNYGIDNIVDISNLIVDGLSFQEACSYFELNEEQTLIAALLIARDSYIREEYELGDSYLNYVEKAKNKSSLVCSLMDRIMKRKKFYKYRTDENYQTLTLTIKNSISNH